MAQVSSYYQNISVDYRGNLRGEQANSFKVGTGGEIYSGTAVTRAGVLAELPNVALGSIYLGTDRMYLKIANAAAATDWQKFTTTAAD